MSIQQQYDDEQWKMEMHDANSAFAEGKTEHAIQLYQAALGTAKQLFIDYKNTEPLPDALTPVLVISYLNLADCWASHNKKDQIYCLVEVYDFLKDTLRDPFISIALSQQIYEGLTKVFPKTCLYFKENGGQQMLENIENNFAELSRNHQSQVSVFH